MQNTLKITHKSVQILHSLSTIDDNNNEKNTLKIVDILGGIDSILAHYLETNDINVMLDNNQLEQLNEMLNKNEQLSSNINEISNNIDKNHHGDFYYNFDENNTYLHSIFSNKTSSTLINTLHSNIIKMIASLGSLVYILLYFFDGANVFYVYTICLTFFIAVPFSVIWILSSNKTAFKLIIFSFEFQFKLVYALLYGILSCILWFQWKHDIIFIIYHIAHGIFMIPLAVIVVSGFDAVKFSKKFKIIITLLSTLVFVYFSIQYQFLVSDEIDYVLYISATNSSFSFSKQLAAITEILAIFMIKQAFYTLYYKEQCALITISPYIKWKKNHQKKENDNITELTINTANDSEKKSDTDDEDIEDIP